MTGETTPLNLGRSLTRLAVASIGALSIAAGWLIVRGKGIAYAIVLALLCSLTGLAGWTFSGLLVLFLWMTSLVHLLKRAIFLFGTQPQVAYYGVLLLPAAILGLLLLPVLRRLRLSAIPVSGRLLVGFATIGLLNTLFSPVLLPTAARIAAVHDRLLPLSLFFIGLLVPLSSPVFVRASTALVVSAIISVVYAWFQFSQGPTLLDRIWAEATAPYSLQGEKTLLVIEDKVQDWRAYSYFADPLTWGLFLVAAFAAVLILFCLGCERKRTCIATLTLLLSGLFVCLTRTPWAGLVVMVAVYVLLRQNSWQSSWILFGFILAAFALATLFSAYLYANHVPDEQPFANPILQRYASIGTLEARVGAWDSLKEAVPQHWLMGTGFGYSSYYAGLADIDVPNLGGHNFLLELTVYTGLPGALLFLAFLWAVLREGTLRLRFGPGGGEQRAVRWLLGFVMGYVVTGYFNGGNFMNYYFFLFAGILAGQSQAGERRRLAVQGGTGTLERRTAV